MSCARSKVMGKIVIAVIAVIFTISFAGFAELSFPNSQATYLGIHEPVTIGTRCIESAALMYIAEDRGFFTGNGLYVTIMDDYVSGAEAIKGMENGEVDISVSAEYPVVIETFKRENISIIGCVDKYEGTYLVTRKDLGLKNVTDLAGKRIGLLRGTEAEFYLGRCLDLHGMSLQDVTLVKYNNQLQSADALANGSVDAFVVEYDLICPIRKQLGENMMIWPQQNRQSTFVVMACRNNWMAEHPELINRLLISLAQAEEYCNVHPDIAKAIVQKRLHRKDEYISAVWPDHQFSLSLDQSLVTAMEDEARWMIKNDLTTERTIPDFRDCIYTKGLEVIKPESVNIW
jgi:NitT/TauT family transport system substrate-binding protein